MPQTDTSKNIQYLGRDFDTIKQGLVEFVKNYYPNTYNDFNEASPGMMFVELYPQKELVRVQNLTHDTL